MQTLRYWILAARPKTLPAAAVPVLTGGALAGAVDLFDPVPWLICLTFALLIQIGTNFANDYYDFIQGADDHRRLGPNRAVASGWIRPAAMRLGMWITFAAAFGVGSLLLFHGGWWLLWIGVASIICGIAYTGGPYPLGYNGWGDVFVFIFFGWIATGITYYVQAGSFNILLPQSSGPLWVWLAGAVPGSLATNLLVVNNVRDAPLDREAGKRTLVARWGRGFGRLEYAALAILAILVPVLFAVSGGAQGCLLVLLSTPLAWTAWRQLLGASDRASYDRALGLTALQLVVCGCLFALGLAVS